ncbi:hypothetical protein F1735_26410 [Massilia sp. CCM 8694]|uniref:50S ribosomal protein L28 n=1 Tax=Massilia genomosp. 1 TaxID=2609280 RepID=A0ABX0MSS0_9BURK|nr:hypothetical protein [Massilia genomosp. 1]
MPVKNRHSRVGGNPRHRRSTKMPWIPAYAGMTGLKLTPLGSDPGLRRIKSGTLVAPVARCAPCIVRVSRARRGSCRAARPNWRGGHRPGRRRAYPPPRPVCRAQYHRCSPRGF